MLIYQYAYVDALRNICIYIYITHILLVLDIFNTFWNFNKTIEHDPFIVDLPIQNSDFP